MNQYIRKEIKKYQIMSWLKYHHAHHFSKPYSFPNGLQKFMNTMVNDHKLLVFYSYKLVLLYTYECDLGDGWEDAEVNNDP
jgi:hypothetical protein